jgi:hypothetical protein
LLVVVCCLLFVVCLFVGWLVGLLLLLLVAMCLNYAATPMAPPMPLARVEHLECQEDWT